MTAADPNVFAVALRDTDGLARYRDAWTALAAAALEPNPFYEPALLLPALRSLRRGAEVEVVLVFRRTTPKATRLIGLFPLERLARYRNLPLPGYRLWKHVHCFLCTPLVAADDAGPALTGLFDWVRGPAAASLLELGHCADDGAFAQALAAVVAARGAASAVVDGYRRALFRPAADLDAYLSSALHPRKRREFERLGRRLGELGRLEATELAPGEDARPWIEGFLELEAAGWKGRDGTALAIDAGERRFFVEGAEALAAAGRLWMLGLALDGKWIALKCNFLSAPGGFAFKIAYDETYARFSPGVLLELETLARLHRRSELAWMDSCAAEDHAMKNRLWTERRAICSWLVADADRQGRLFVKALPWLQRLRRRLARSAPAAPAALGGNAA